MKIRILCVGKLKEKYLREAQAEYAKRLSRYCTLEIEELPDEKTPDRASEKEEAAILQKEGERILARLRPSEYVIALAIKGRSYTSEAFAEHLEERLVSSGGSLVLVIGGSLGLSDDVLRRAGEKISFSDLTFPHQLMRILLLEQTYRAFRILHHEPYHK